MITFMQRLFSRKMNTFPDIFLLEKYHALALWDCYVWKNRKQCTSEGTSIFQQLFALRARKLRVTVRMHRSTIHCARIAFSFVPLNERCPNAVCNKEETKRGMIKTEKESIITNEPVIRLKVLWVQELRFEAERCVITYRLYWRL